MNIYKITNKIDGKIYIGQTTKSISDRFTTHCSKSNNRCSVLSRAIHRYGKENFEIECLLKLSNLEELNKAEKDLIKQYNCLVPRGYNLASGGENGGKRPGWTNSKSFQKGRHYSPKTEFKKGMVSKSPRCKPGCQNLESAIKVRCIDTKIEYESMAAAARHIGGIQQGVNKVILGQRKRYKGLRFEKVVP